jgi:hypothetical protein
MSVLQTASAPQEVLRSQFDLQPEPFAPHPPPKIPPRPSPEKLVNPRSSSPK